MAALATMMLACSDEGETGTGGSASDGGEGVGGSGSGGSGGSGASGGATGFTLGGVASGIEGTVVLSHGSASVAISGDGPWSFEAPLVDGASYEVALDSAPQLSRCILSSSKGVVSGRAVTDVALRCSRKHLFVGNDGTRRRVYITDGTEAGTRPLGDINPNGDAFPTSRMDAEDRVFLGNGRAVFRGVDGVNPGNLFVTDGTDEGTTPVDPTKASGAQFGWPVSDGVAVFSHGRGLGQTDGTALGTVDIVELSAEVHSPTLAGVVGDKMIVQRGAPNGSTLQYVATDGTSGGTIPITEAIYHPQVFPQVGRAEVGGKVLFPWETPSENSRNELWVTDGTTAGTMRIAAPSQSMDTPANGDIVLTEAGGRVWMAVGNAQFGREPWVTDGTALGTKLLLDVLPGPTPSDPLDFVVLGDRVAFVASTSSGSGTRSVFLTDGTSEGTVALDDGLTGQRRIVGTSEAGLFYTGAGGLHVTDGTPAGTRKLLDLPGSIISAKASIGELILFSMESAEFGYELYASDGTPEGTRRLTDICPGSCSYLNGL